VNLISPHSTAQPLKTTTSHNVFISMTLEINAGHFYLFCRYLVGVPGRGISRKALNYISHNKDN